jgi:hypothetical protein
VADWVTISSLATAGGTLVLAGATFAAVRSANRSTRLAEQSLLAGIRPLLISSRMDDPPQKVYFADAKYVVAPGGQAGIDLTDEAIYLAVALRNAGSGIAVLHGWGVITGDYRQPEHLPLDSFTRLTRDLYLGARELGYWQGSFRDPSSEEFVEVLRVIRAREPFGIEILYGDEEGGQRRISRFGLLARGEREWLAEAGRHWNLDRADPR